MANIEVDDFTKHTVAFAARMANLSEAAIIRRLIADLVLTDETPPQTTGQGIAVYADYDGHRVHARYIDPTRVEIIDGALAGQSFKSPTGAARAVIRHYNPDVNDNRNGWSFWQIDDDSGTKRSLQTIRPKAVRSGRGSLRGQVAMAEDWDSAEVNEAIAQDFGLTP